jgi:hypothetical protein
MLFSVKGWVRPRAIVLLEGLSQMENPITSSGIETATFRLVAYSLNQLHDFLLYRTVDNIQKVDYCSIILLYVLSIQLLMVHVFRKA